MYLIFFSFLYSYRNHIINILLKWNFHLSPPTTNYNSMPAPKIKLKINTRYFNKINLDPGGVVVTAKGTSSDFVSRYFTPQSTILEDPATGSSHCSLIPFWSKRLNKTHLTSVQLSKRIGEFECINHSKRVTVIGSAVNYSKTTITI